MGLRLTNLKVKHFWIVNAVSMYLFTVTNTCAQKEQLSIYFCGKNNQRQYFTIREDGNLSMRKLYGDSFLVSI